LTGSEEISVIDARRVAIFSSGLSKPFASVEAALSHLAIVQLDTISVVARAHAFTLASRLATQTVSAVDEALWKSGQAPVAFEYWGHAASLIPLNDWPLWQFRRDRIRSGDLDWRPSLGARAEVLATVDQLGPSSMTQIRGDEQGGVGWGWSAKKTVIEYLIWSGELVCVQRKGWNRLFDLPERALPQEVLNAPVDALGGLVQLISKAGQALGVATAEDLADYLRIKRKEVASLIERTVLRPVRVEGWKQSAWVHPNALEVLETPPREAACFIGPFDNLIWYRPRLRRLFDFDHTLEAYKPAAKRRYGYFALPLLVGTRFVGRADIRIDQNDLTVQSWSIEDGFQVPVEACSDALNGLARITQATVVDDRISARTTNPPVFT